MGKGRYTIAKGFLDRLKQEKGEVINFTILKEEIMKNIGAVEDKTVRPYIRLMRDLRLITIEGENVRIN